MVKLLLRLLRLKVIFSNDSNSIIPFVITSEIVFVLFNFYDVEKFDFEPFLILASRWRFDFLLCYVEFNEHKIPHSWNSIFPYFYQEFLEERINFFPLNLDYLFLPCTST